MLLDFGRVDEALIYYRRAVDILGDAPLIRIPYAQALIESAGQNNTTQLDEAIVQLERAARDEPRTTRIYRLLATAWGRKGSDPMARLYLAEEALLKQDRDYAKKQAIAAMTGLEEGSHPWLRAQDILTHLKKQPQKRNKEKG